MLQRNSDQFSLVGIIKFFWIPSGEVVLVAVVMTVVVDIVDVDVDSWILVVVDMLEVAIVSLLVTESLPEVEYLVVVSPFNTSLVGDPADAVVVATVESVVGVIKGPSNQYQNSKCKFKWKGLQLYPI